MRVGLLSAWASRLGGGVFEAVVAQAALLRAIGHEPVVFALEDRHSAADRRRFGDIEVTTCSVVGPRAIGYAPALVGRMLGSGLDVLHLHGIWMYPSRAGADWAASTGRPYLVSPHGMLDPWITGRGRLKKALARAGYERRSWQLATRLHALTAREAADIARETGDGNRILVIPNAVPPSARRAMAVGEAPYVLYLGRIHPKKNLDALLDGWRLADGKGFTAGGNRLLIAGWGEAGHVDALKRRLAREAREDVAFIGPVYGAHKEELLSAARFLALPSLSEGLPVSVLEAWAAGTPALISDGCNLPEGIAQGAALDCGTQADSIAAALRTGLSLPAARWQAMSAAASALIAERFSPEAVARKWQEALCSFA